MYLYTVQSSLYNLEIYKHNIGARSSPWLKAEFSLDPFHGEKENVCLIFEFLSLSEQT